MILEKSTMRKKRILVILSTLFLVLFFYLTVQLFTDPKPLRPVILTLQTYPVSQEEIEYLKKVNPYGIILFEYSFKTGGLPLPLKQELQKRLHRPDLLFFIDMEGGSVNRLKSLFPKKEYPAAKTFGDLAQTNLEETKQKIYEYGKMVGNDLLLHGFDVNFAPAAEVCVDNNFLKSRCFSQNPQITASLASSFAEGLAEAGIEPAYKHAPGISFAKMDPHSSKSLINRSMEQLKSTEMQAMKGAYKWKYLLIGHALYSAIDPYTTSTYSPTFYEFIRKELNFDGLIVTDALNMKTALLPDKTRGEQMYLALEAGADIVMPFFDNRFSFAERWQEIQKITPQQIENFNKKIKKAPVK